MEINNFLFSNNIQSGFFKYTYDIQFTQETKFIIATYFENICAAPGAK